MKETRRHPEEASSVRNSRLTIFRILLWGTAVSIVLALSIVCVLHWRQASKTNASDPYATIPFRPRVTYGSLNISITNTEEEPYLNTSLNLYVGATLYSAQIGAVRPGETITRPLRSLTNERGESFDPTAPMISELEVRAHFGGYDVHKDFPPPR
jgi:hypothetical protein